MFDLAHHTQEAGRIRERTAAAHELAVLFKGTFPTEVVIQIHLAGHY